MNSYVAEKHWLVWAMPIFWSIVFCWTIIIPFFLLGYTYLRIKMDTIEVKDGCLYSRVGLLIIDKKTIPLDKISFINVKADFISEKFGAGSIIIQSSADLRAIIYPYIKNPEKLVQFINENK